MTIRTDDEIEGVARETELIEAVLEDIAEAEKLLQGRDISGAAAILQAACGCLDFIKEHKGYA